jgi:hypothetical protein
MSSGVDATATAEWAPRRRLIAGVCLIVVHMVAIAVLLAVALYAP